MISWRSQVFLFENDCMVAQSPITVRLRNVSFSLYNSHDTKSCNTIIRQLKILRLQSPVYNCHWKVCVEIVYENGSTKLIEKNLSWDNYDWYGMYCDNRSYYKEFIDNNWIIGKVEHMWSGDVLINFGTINFEVDNRINYYINVTIQNVPPYCIRKNMAILPPWKNIGLVKPNRIRLSPDDYGSLLCTFELSK
ncbi:hypothetical protein [Helicoverpa armigera nucleopolyhedrovirus]|uniref:Uncharacterized protein n=1 Tax=Helicoverpa armigera nucleopolyhedrovirus TaxID=51313 RepID=Q91BU9_9ABAC|nr:hypothetical protein [Helicoverpa armigera nucleopolyhedrovirus]AAK96351.1 unknown [Helicoverpa armigera nucleopolyhedrovirus]